MEAFETAGYSGYITFTIDDNEPLCIAFSFKCKIEVNFDNLEIKNNLIESVEDVQPTGSGDFLEDVLVAEANIKSEMDTTENTSVGAEYENFNDSIEMKENTETTDFTCGFCDRKFNTYAKMKNHCEKHLKEEKIKEKKAPAGRRSNRHIPEDLLCKFCNTSFSSSEEYHKHRIAHNTPHDCPACSKTCRSKAQLIVHKHTVHPEFDHELLMNAPPDTELDLDSLRQLRTSKSHDTVICPICFNSFNKGYLVLHVMTAHTKEGRFQCCICSAKTKTVDEWHDHGETHLGIASKGPKCKRCGEIFETWEKFHTHLSTEHKNKNTCVFCFEEFAFYSLLKQHYATEHLEQMWKCDKCDAMFTKATSLKTHVTNLHNSKFSGQCPTCGMHVRNIKHHMKDAHPSKDKIFECPHCPNFYYTHPRLKKHLDTHNTQRYECNICQKVLKTLNSLRTHLKLHGYNKSEYECKVCGKKMSRRDNLQSHMKTHNESIPFYQCDQCEERFNYNIQLQHHLRSVHGAV